MPATLNADHVPQHEAKSGGQPGNAISNHEAMIHRSSGDVLLRTVFCYVRMCALRASKLCVAETSAQRVTGVGILFSREKRRKTQVFVQVFRFGIRVAFGNGHRIHKTRFTQAIGDRPMTSVMTFRRVEATDEIKAEIDQQTEKLMKKFDRISNCDVVVEKCNHHHEPDTYVVRLLVGVPRKQIIVDHVEDRNLHAAVSDAFRAARRQLNDYRNVLQAH